MKRNLSIGCTNTSCIPLISKLFELGYRPDNLRVYHPPDQILLEQFCKQLSIHSTIISNNDDFSKYVTQSSELMLNISGIDFLISERNIKKFPKGIINLHTGLLEDYRGRWMPSWALINNEKFTGYTWHYVNNQFDSGNIIHQEKFLINEHDTAFSLNFKILNCAINSLEYVLSGSPGTPPVKLGKYFNKEKPFNGTIQDAWSDDQIKQFIKAMYHPPYKPAILLKNNAVHYVSTFEEYKNL